MSHYHCFLVSLLLLSAACFEAAATSCTSALSSPKLCCQDCFVRSIKGRMVMKAKTDASVIRNSVPRKDEGSNRCSTDNAEDDPAIVRHRK